MCSSEAKPTVEHDPSQSDLVVRRRQRSRPPRDPPMIGPLETGLSSPSQRVRAGEVIE